MVTLAYVGRSPDSDGMILPKSYTDSTNAAAALTTTWVNNAIATVTPTLTTQSYVDEQNALLAQQTQVTQADQAFVATTALNAVNGVAGLDSGGNLISSQLPLGIVTDRIMKSYSLSVPSIIFDSNSGSSGLWSDPAWSHTALPGATLIVDCVIDGATPGRPTYGGVTMNQAYANGSYGRFYLQNVPGGNAPIQFPWPGYVWWAGSSASYLNVGSVGATTAITSSPYALSTPGGMAVFGVGLNTYYSAAISGGATVRASGASSFASSVIGDSAVATSLAYSGNYAVVTILNPSTATSGQVGQVAFSGSLTVAANAASQKLAAIYVPDPGYPWRPIPFAWVRGDSSGATKPANRQIGTGSYGLLTVSPPSTVSSQVYGAGICTGSYFTDIYPVFPFAAPGQTPASVPPITGAMELDLYGSCWSGASYTYYSGNLVYFVLLAPAV